MYLAFKALADQTRREILTLLSRGDMTAGEIAGHFDMAWPSISHHLFILKRAELITCTRERQSFIYSLNAEGLREIILWLRSLGEREEVRQKILTQEEMEAYSAAYQKVCQKEKE